MRVRVLSLLVLALLVAACGEHEKTGSKSGWTRHAVADGRFSVETPASWKTLTNIDPKKLEKLAGPPELAPYAQALIRNKAIKLISLDPAIQDDFSSNLNVIVSPLNSTVTLAGWIEAENRVTRRVAVPGSLRTTYVELPAGQAARVTWELQANAGDGNARIASLQFLFLHNGNGYVLTYTTLPQLTEQYRATFARSARSFRFD